MLIQHANGENSNVNCTMYFNTYFLVCLAGLVLGFTSSTCSVAFTVFSINESFTTARSYWLS